MALVILEGEAAAAAWRWRHFSPAEFTSRGADGPQLRIETAFLDRLEELRRLFGHPMPVSSGYRTPAHNVAVSSTGPTGPHTTGRACDVAVSGALAFALVRLALDCGFTGIGVRQHGASRFVHLDDLRAPAFPRPRIWSYA